MIVFVDTSVWYAAADVSDRSHERAKFLLTKYAGTLVTSDHILIETWYLSASRMGYNQAELLLVNIRSGLAQVESAQASDLQLAESIGQRFQDQKFSIVDRTSWAVMQRLGMHTALSFDKDFSIYRFGRNNRQAFTVYG